MPTSIPPPVMQPAPTAPRYGFAGMMIGADLKDLKAVRPKATCIAKGDGFTDCVAPDQSIGGYPATDLTYRFASGKLVQISFKSSVDAFTFVVAELKHDFGLPSDVHRDEVRVNGSPREGRDLPHVTFIWRNGRSTIRMSDPATPGQLMVDMNLDGADVPAKPGPA